MNWLLVLGALLFAAAVIGFGRISRPTRWGCSVCSATFGTSVELADHLDSHGRCAERRRDHTCVEWGGHRGAHLCGCGLSWVR